VSLNISRQNLQLIGAGLLIGGGIGVLLIFGVFGDGLPVWGAGDLEGIPPQVPELGSSAPNFELNSLSGELTSLEQFRGRPVLINFWATWCGPCRLEMPLLQEYQAEYDSEVVVMAVNVGESAEDVQAFVDEMALDLTVLLDEGNSVEKMYQVRGLPSTFFVNADGIIRFAHIGMLTEGQLLGYLDELGVIE
jgi:thiol-disulfide isomerase/thioredoxin